MFKRIAAALVSNSEGQRAVEKAVELAADFHADLQFLVIAQSPGVTQAFASVNGPEVAQMVENDRERSLDSAQEQALSLAKSKGISTTVQHVDSEVVGTVLDILKQQQADLFVVGLHRGGPAIGRIWNKVVELADQAPCAILGVP